MAKNKKLKHNPKLSQKRKSAKTKKNIEESYEEYEDYKNYTPYYMAIIAITVFIVIIVLFAVTFGSNVERVQKYDSVKLDYEIYTLDEYENHEDPSIKKTNTWVNVCSRYDDDCKDGLIQGFYDKLIGKKVGDVVNYELIKACVDKDKDGKDDITGEDALSYGFPEDELYDTDIVLWFKVLEINKSSSESESAEAASLNISNNILNSFFSEILLIIDKKAKFLFL
ncbi:MAG: hypothetical protein ACTSQS_16950 [Promethearchaeota archaeon]